MDGVGTYPEWRAGELRKSEEYSMGFSSFELDFTKIEEDLFSKLLKLQSEEEEGRLEEFIGGGDVGKRVVEAVLRN